MASVDYRFDSRLLCAQAEAWLVIDRGTQMSFAVFPLGNDKNRAIIASAMMQTPVFLYKAFNSEGAPKTMNEMPKWFGDSNQAADGTTLAFCWLWCFDYETLMNVALSSEWKPGHFEIDVQACREALISKDGMTDTKRKVFGLQAQLTKLKQGYSETRRAAEDRAQDAYFMNRLTSQKSTTVAPVSTEMRGLAKRIAEVEGEIQQLRAAGDGSAKS